jgi:hypothetical protein
VLLFVDHQAGLAKRRSDADAYGLQQQRHGARYDRSDLQSVIDYHHQSQRPRIVAIPSATRTLTGALFAVALLGSRSRFEDKRGPF